MNGGLVGLHDDPLDVLTSVLQQMGMGGYDVEQSLKSARRLMLIKAKLEVHPHDSEVISAVCEHKIEWRFPFLRYSPERRLVRLVKRESLCEARYVLGLNTRNMDSGFLNMSIGPTKPRIARLTDAARRA